MLPIELYGGRFSAGSFSQSETYPRQAMYGINTHRLDLAITDAVVGEEITYRFTFPMNLGKGSYSISTSLSKLDSHLDGNYEWRDLGLIFHVINTRHEDFVGCAWLESTPSIERSRPALPGSA